MMLHLNPSIPVYIPSKNCEGEAIGWIDYTKEDDLFWIVALDDGGEVWVLNNKEVRLCKNFSIGRK